jgi:hypothetical protein
MFGPNSMNKALCGCGAIADLDIEVVRRKRDLGKRVECSRCRNDRIAHEREEMERLFTGAEAEECDYGPELKPPYPAGLRYQLTKLR